MLAELTPGYEVHSPSPGLPFPTQTYIMRLQRSKGGSRLPTWREEPS